MTGEIVTLQCEQLTDLENAFTHSLRDGSIAISCYCCGDVWMKNDESKWYFACILICHSDHAGVCDVGVSEKVAFQLRRGDLETFGLDDFLNNRRTDFQRRFLTGKG